MPTMIENYYIILQLYELFWTIDGSEKFEKKSATLSTWLLRSGSVYAARGATRPFRAWHRRCTGPSLQTPSPPSKRSLVNKRNDRSGGPRRKPLASSPNNLWRSRRGRPEAGCTFMMSQLHRTKVDDVGVSGTNSKSIITYYSWFTYSKWWFSIVMLVY